MTGKVEGGQGARTEITQAAAEELRVAADRIRLLMADTNLVPDDGITAGSRTTPSTIPAVRNGCSAARNVLLELAADKWNVSREALNAKDGAIVHPPTNRQITYADLAAVAARLMANDPLLTADKAAWLAPHWARPAASGGFELQADPAHKRINPVLYQVDEVLETWKHITAPLLWVDGDQTDTAKWWGHRYSRDEFHRRLGVVNRVEKLTLSPCGHMLHHDQPAALAQALARFLG